MHILRMLSGVRCWRLIIFVIGFRVGFTKQEHIDTDGIGPCIRSMNSVCVSSTSSSCTCACAETLWATQTSEPGDYYYYYCYYDDDDDDDYSW